MKSPCDLCICLPMCLSGDLAKIMMCDLLAPIFLSKGRDLDEGQHVIIEFDPYKNFKFKISRDSIYSVSIELIYNGILLLGSPFVSLPIFSGNADGIEEEL